ncbi:hypothetical protein BS50DRAFT_77890 [Corynespora cassiicola Philippines]|uniref:Uncharacterized protein n=1 Tax=Corynespora cassiicola Philippines TaxID=1448308 RepID=A0A2T2NGU3_CORCC|nr:hypothetical protein BS50DRAFT_77890 [Corynespora cassiicola Philippines]
MDAERRPQGRGQRAEGRGQWRRVWSMWCTGVGGVPVGGRSERVECWRNKTPKQTTRCDAALGPCIGQQSGAGTDASFMGQKAFYPAACRTLRQTACLAVLLLAAWQPAQEPPSVPIVVQGPCGRYVGRWAPLAWPGLHQPCPHRGGRASVVGRAGPQTKGNQTRSRRSRTCKTPVTARPGRQRARGMRGSGMRG